MPFLPTVEAKDFEVTGMRWNTVGIPNLSFLVTYQGFSASAGCRYEAYDGEKLVASGSLMGQFMKEQAIQADIVFGAGLERVTLIRFLKS